MGTHRSSLLTSILSNWTALAVNILSGLVLTPLIIAHLGKAHYGLWTLVWTIVGYYGLLNLGVTTSVVRNVARSTANADNAQANEVAANALALFSVAGLAAAGISFFAATPLSQFFSIEPSEQALFIKVIRLLGLLAGISLPGAVPGALLRAHQRFVASNAGTIISELLRFGLYVYVLQNGYGLWGLSIVSLLSTVLKFAVHSVQCMVLLPSFRIRPRQVRIRTIFCLVSFGFFVWITQVSNILITQLDAAVIGASLTMEDVAVYGIAALVIRYYYHLSSSLQGVFTPRLSQLSTKPLAQLQTRFLGYGNLSGLAGFGIGTIIVITAPSFVQLWVGDGFESTIIVLWILLSGAAVDFATNTSFSAAVAVDRHRLYGYAALLEGAANVALSILLVRRLGIVGVALGTTIPRLILKCTVLSAYAAHAIQVGLLRYLTASVVRPGLAALATIAISFGLNLHASTHTLPRFVLSTVLVSAVFALWALLVGLSGEYRTRVRSRILFATWERIQRRGNT